MPRRRPCSGRIRTASAIGATTPARCSRYLWWPSRRGALALRPRRALGRTPSCSCRAPELSTRDCRRSSRPPLALTVCSLVSVVASVRITSSPTGFRSGTCSTSHRSSCSPLLAWIERGAPRPRVPPRSPRPLSAGLRRRLPVRPLHRDFGDHGHAHAAAVLVAPGDRIGTWLRPAAALLGSRTGGRRSSSSRALRSRPSVARARPLDPCVDGRSGGGTSPTAFEQASRGRVVQGIRTDRAGLGRRAPAAGATWPSSWTESHATGSP